MTSINKLDAAQIQLDCAIQKFFEGSHVCSVTLAGAAEEILGSLLKNSGKQSPFEFLHEWYQTEYAVKITKRDFSREIANMPRNWLKHADEDADSEVDISNKDSMMLLMRAVPCYYKLTGRHSEEMERFYEYVRFNKDEIDALMSEWCM